MSEDAFPLTLLAESENFAVLRGEDTEGEEIYNIELGTVTLHLFREEFDDLLHILNQAKSAS